jgi:hypothetical protein
VCRVPIFKVLLVALNLDPISLITSGQKDHQQLGQKFYRGIQALLTTAAEWSVEVEQQQ